MLIVSEFGLLLFVHSDMLIKLDNVLNCIVLDNKSTFKFSIDMVYSEIFDLVRLLSTTVPNFFCC